MSALTDWAMNYRRWEEEMAFQRRACLACEQRESFDNQDTNLSDCQPGVYKHGGEFCKRRR